MTAAAPRTRHYQLGDASDWDELVAASTRGTLLHTRRYLSYHGDRFEDQSLVVTAADRLVAVFPAAIDPNDSAAVVSHPGITYGGLLARPRLNADDTHAILAEVAATYRASGFARLVYKAVPSIFHRHADADDVHALFRLGATWHRSDLAAFVDVAHRGQVADGRSWSIRRARRAGVEVTWGCEQLTDVWPVITAVLRERHGATPTHSRAEMEQLMLLFPDSIHCVAARQSAAVIAGAVVYETDTTLHTQYLASTSEGRQLSALDVVIEAIIDRATALSKRSVSLGTSVEEGGRTLNVGLHQYKTSFGAATCTFDTYALALG